MASSEAVTADIRVRVEARYDPDRSRPDARHWFFLYTIEIANLGNETVQLLSRHWIITDANGAVEEVRGPGVVGEQPVLEPGETFEYTSACPLRTPFGTMHGSYEMVSTTGRRFDIAIAPFALAEPHGIN